MNSKFLLLIYLLLFLSIHSSRTLKEENQEEENQESCDDETCETPKEARSEFSKIRKENMPHSQVLLPIRRIGTSNMEIGVGPCGGVEKKSANTLTTKGSSINFIWEVLVPENSGNCTVKISNGRQDNESFKLLKPVDSEVNSDGSFKCGREKGFEHREFILPENYECDGCTLQWKWSTSYGEVYSCSDIIINGGQLSKCMGKCLNGGSCFNGECLCVKGYTGDFCEDEEGQSSLTWLWIILGLLGIGASGYGIYYFWPKIKESQPWTMFFNKKVKHDLSEDKKNDDIVDTNRFESNSRYP